MARQQTEDELFEIKNYYFIGNYQSCVKEAVDLAKTSTQEIAVLRDIYAYRAFIAQRRYRVPLNEIPPAAAPDLQHVKFLAEYYSSPEKREELLKELEQKLSGNVQSDTLILVAASIYDNEGNLEAAYRVLHSSENLEAMAFIIDILLRIDRVDLARKKLKDMQEKDDDATLTQLAQAWVNIASGGEKLQDAYYIYQELVDKYGATAQLLNGQAVAFIGQAKYEEAEAALQEAIEKNSNYPDTLINSIVLSRHTGKAPEIANRYLSQLMEANSDHPYIKEIKKKEAEFANIIQQYAVTNPTVPTTPT